MCLNLETKEGGSPGPSEHECALWAQAALAFRGLLFWHQSYLSLKLSRVGMAPGQPLGPS